MTQQVPQSWMCVIINDVSALYVNFQFELLIYGVIFICKYFLELLFLIAL